MELKYPLLPHQEAAVNKLRGLKVGALYMEQGTGKTRTTLDLIKTRLDKDKIDRAIWLCPCTVRQNLKEDILYHCGEIPEEIMVRGIESLSSSDKLYLELLGIVRKYRCMLVVDESNLVKNPFAKRTIRIKTISEKCKYKIILNGTPVSRNEADLYAQWYLLDWRILGYQSYYSFASNHIEYKTVRMPDGREIKTDQIARILDKQYLTQKISPYTYQIKKADCLTLPEKNYEKVWAYLTSRQYDHYDEVKERYLENVKEWKSETIYKLFTALQHVASGRRVISSPEEQMKTEPMYAWDDNPRIKALKGIVESIGDEQCIIYAKYKSEVEEIENLLSDMGKNYAEFTGRIKQTQRQENRKKFQNGVQFLIANKVCGCYGLNLQFCHNIIFYSNDFDYATRAQAEDRVHRLGQTHTVHVYDICGSDTIDEFIATNLMNKEDMVAALKRQIDKWKDEKITKKKLLEK